jgi:hypothetical protein
MSVAVEFHPDAADEAVATHEWYAERSEKAALRFLMELDRAIENIGEFPDRSLAHMAAANRAIGSDG